MEKIITIIIFVLAFGKMQAQTQWNIVPTPNDTISTHYSYLLNVIDSLNVILTPRYTFDSSNIIKTTDGGQTWNSYIIDSTMYTILHEVEFIDKKTGYIAGGTDYGDWRILLKTENGGQTWKQINTDFFPTFFPTQISEISFITDQIGFIARNGENKVYRTTNGGINFTALTLSQLTNGTYTNLTEMRFISPYVGFMIRMLTDDYINSTSEILKTNDGGNTWNVINSMNWQNIDLWNKKDKIQFVNNLQGFAITGTGVLLTTQDIGNTWTELNLPLATPPPTDFYFINNACGYIALAGNIYRTDDAGQSWSLQTIENNLNGVNYIQFDMDKGYALNDELLSNNRTISSLLKTKQQPATALSSKEFIDDNTFNIYPNPAHNLINIQNSSNNNINFIHLMDTSGKIIKTYKDDLEHLDVSSVSSGNYLLFIQTSKQKIVKKVIIK